LGLYSNISWVAMLCTWVAGGTVIVMPGFDARSTLETIARERITHFAMVPVQFQRLVDDEAYATSDRSSLQAVMCCGSPLPFGLKQQLLEDLGGAFIELYGLTEGLITTHDPETACDRLGSVGQALTGTEVRIIDDAGHECAPGEPGEIVGRGRILMSGYLNRDDANAESTWTDMAGARWLRTGDIGRMDEDGHLWIVDRKKDMIVSGGQNIFPADIEAVMLAHPDIADVAVIGVPSEKWGETPLALVVPRRDAPEAEVLCAWANARLGRQQRISGVRLRESLPRNPNGKVLKRELRREYTALAH
ncbi:MAG: AMP-binding protein, partial [Gammaproteobacteria bacterium]|nr:AMP-binding protein [Gammaproteobacteria bacterium]